MSVFDSVPTTAAVVRTDEPLLSEAELAAVAFLARYSGRTLESYRADLRQYLAWITSAGVPSLQATRAHLELYPACLEERRLAAATIDRRLSTVCGYYRFAHLDGRIATNPAQHLRRPQVHPSTQRGLDRGELAAFLYRAERVSPTHAALAVLLGLNGQRVSEACGANVEDLGIERGHRTLRIVGKGNQPAIIPLVPRTARTVDLAVGERATGPVLLRHDGGRLVPAQPTAGSVRSVNGPAWITSTRTCCARRSSWPPSTPACRCATCSWPPATPTRGPPPSTTGAGRTSTARRLRRGRLRHQRLTQRSSVEHRTTTSMIRRPTRRRQKRRTAVRRPTHVGEHVSARLPEPG